MAPEEMRTTRAAAEGLLAGFETVDREMAAHCRRVSVLAAHLAKAAGFSQDACAEVEVSALLHDVGKFGIPQSILKKPGPLSPGERSLIEEHSQTGAEIVARVESLQSFAAIVAHHHERWDGAGYPCKIGGCEIPAASRAIAIVDAWDAMVEPRGYAPTRARAEAKEEILRCAGSQFDPALARVFVECVVERVIDAPEPVNAALAA